MPWPQVIEKVKDSRGQIVKIDPYVKPVMRYFQDLSVAFHYQYSTHLVSEVKEE